MMGTAWEIGATSWSPSMERGLGHQHHRGRAVAAGTTRIGRPGGGGGKKFGRDDGRRPVRATSWSWTATGGLHGRRTADGAPQITNQLVVDLGQTTGGGPHGRPVGADGALEEDGPRDPLAGRVG